MKYDISSIKVGERHRPLDDAKVRQIAESMKLVGQISPVIIAEDGSLIAGRHRMEAAKFLGWTRLNAEFENHDFILSNLAIDLGASQRPAKCSKCNGTDNFTIDKSIIKDSHDKYDYWWVCGDCGEFHPLVLPNMKLLDELVEIMENLSRNNLTVAEEGEHLIRQDEIIDSFGASAKIDKSILKIDGVSEKTKGRRKKAVGGLDRDVLDLVKDTSLADNQSELLKLVKLNKVDQAEFINQYTLGTVKSVDEFMSRKTQISLNNLTIPEIHLADYNLTHTEVNDKTIDLIITQPAEVGSDDYIESVLYACLPKVKIDGRCFLFIDASPNIVNKYLEKFYEGRTGWVYLDILNITVWAYKNYDHQSGTPGFSDNLKFVLHIAGDDAPNLNASGSSLSSLMEYNAVVNEFGANFPDTLVARIIGVASKDGDMVLDPYMKSDVVLKTSSAMGRKSIGFSEDTDSVPKWVNTGYRIKNMKNDKDDGVF
jgi:hypothetical protein